jgi:hypothetical protein
LEKSWGEDGTGFHRFSVLGSAEGERWQAELRCSPPHDPFSHFDFIKTTHVEKQWRRQQEGGDMVPFQTRVSAQIPNNGNTAEVKVTTVPSKRRLVIEYVSCDT